MRALLLILVGCGGPASMEGMPKAEVLSPWKRLGVPFEEGRVVDCHLATCTVAYNGGDPVAHAAPYTAALVEQGWKSEALFDQKGQWTATFERDGDRIVVRAGLDDFAGKLPGGRYVTLESLEEP